MKIEKSALLEYDQYNLIVRLLNSALQDDNTINNTNVATKIIPLVAAFHRKLGPSVIQFAYTSVQEHAVWNNIQFWEEAFFVEAQRQIVELHVKERQRKLDLIEKEHLAKLAKKTKQEEAHDIVKKTLSDGDLIKTHAEKLLVNTTEGKANRNSMLLTPNMRIRSLTRGSVPNEVDDDQEKKKNVKDMPNAMKLAAELVQFLLFFFSNVLFYCILFEY